MLPKGGISQHSVSITFGTGKVSGTFVKDKACLGGADSENPGCATVNMVVANDMSDQPFSLFHFDGILGLGLEALSLGPGFSFFGQMAAELPQMQSQFSVFLARSDQGQSSISFGGHDESKAASGFWVAVQGLGFRVYYPPIMENQMEKKKRIKWKLVEYCNFKELNCSYYIGETVLFTIYTHSGNLI